MNKLIMIFTGLMTAATSAHAGTTGSLGVNLQKTKYFNQSQYDTLLQAKALIEVVINSEEFKKAIINFKYEGKNEFVQNNGLTNQQVYDNLMTGAEMYPKQTAVDGMMDFDLELYTSSWFGRGVLGYTNQDTTVISINTRFYNNAEVNAIAMNLVHEWTHKMGFGHDANRTARRDFSVPYAVGYLIRDLAKKPLTKRIP